MRDTWMFFRMLLRYRSILIGAAAASVISAACLGAGLASILPVWQAVIGTTDAQGKPVGRRDLPELARSASEFLDSRVGIKLPTTWIDSLPSGTYTALVTIMVCLGLLTLVGSLANYLRQYWTLTATTRTLADIRERTFAHTTNLPLASVAGKQSTVVSHTIADTYFITAGMEVLLSKVFDNALKGIAAGLIALITNPVLTLATAAVGIPLGVIVRKLGTRIRRASRAGLAAQAEVQRNATESLTHLRVVKTSNAEERELERFSEVNREHMRSQMRVRAAKSLAGPLTEMVALIVLGVIVVVVGKAILDGKLRSDQVMVSLVAIVAAAAILKPLATMYTELQQMNAAAKRVKDLLAQPTEHEIAKDQSLPALARHNSSIELRNLSFTYPGADRPALTNINLTIKHGQTVAFVGPNGCGKTTLLSLLPRLFDPTTGSILIDNINIASISLASLRNQIGVVTQETALFKGTIRWNLTYGVAHASDQQLQAATAKARAQEFIMAKPKTYDFVLGEGGSGLSGGQRQRLAIARAILRDPAILILDEATSMIDADSERTINDALVDFSKGRTSLVVAHRLSTVLRADLIVVMNQGTIEDVGTHAELLLRSPTYQLIAQTQLIESPQALGPTHA
jgi:ABC-type multidrug transport system fused ATPase/permease subunit